MKLSKETLTVLKNFATVNSNLWVPHGRRIRTMTTMKTTLAEATLPDEFERDFGIYDLSMFLSVLGMYDEPEIQFKDQFMTIGDLSGRSHTRFYYASPSVVLKPSDKNLGDLFGDADVSFDLPSEDLKRVMKSAAVLRNPEIAFVSRAGETTVDVVATNVAVDTANEFSSRLGSDVAEERDFMIVFKTTNLLMIETDYRVTLSEHKLAQFVGKHGGADLTYWVASEKDGRYS